MSLSILTTLLSAIAKILPSLTGSTAIQNIIDVIVAFLPLIASTYSQLLPQVQDIISVLTQSDDITDDQIKTLQAASALIDAHAQSTIAAARLADAAYRAANPGAA